MTLPFPHKTNQLLSDYSTFGIGGPARYLAEAKTPTQMQQMLEYAHKHALPVHILGKGSNSLFHDQGFNGLVILNKIDFLEQQGEIFTAGAGYSFARLGGITAKSGYSGLEFASGIPATVGGAVFMNAGANGHEVADVLTRVRYVTEKGELITFTRDDLYFGYRTSAFQKWRGAIVEASFTLHPSETAKQRQKEILDYRLGSQPYGEKSAGCAFRNPEDGVAGQLIDHCGFKGLNVGGAEVSPKHANFIVNRGGAKAADVRALLDQIKEQIATKTGVNLEEEIRFIPYDI